MSNEVKYYKSSDGTQIEMGKVIKWLCKKI